MRQWRGASLILIFALICGYVSASVSMGTGPNSMYNPAAQQGSAGSGQQGTYTNQQGQGYAPMQGQIPAGIGLVQSGFNSGMFDASFADTEHQAQVMVVESAATALNWIGLNSTRFAEGCRKDKPALISEISGIVAQENSCEAVEREANACDPKKFCPGQQSGHALPVEMKIALNAAGYDTKTIGINDITLDMLTNACKAQWRSRNDSQKQMLEKLEQSIAQQIPRLREQCKQRAQGMTNVIVRLPDVYVNPVAIANVNQQMGMLPMMQRTGIDTGQGGGAGCTSETMPRCQQNEHPECWGNVWNCVAPSQSQGGGGMIQCPQQGPDCGPSAPPYCENGIWKCPQVQEQPWQPNEGTTTAETVTQEQAVQQTETGGGASGETTEGTTGETGSTTTETTSESGGTEQAAADAGIGTPATGLSVAPGIGMAVCGNGICEPGRGESYDNCSRDCMQGAGQQGTYGGGQQGYGPAQGSGLGSAAQQGGTISPQAVAGMVQGGGGTMVVTTGGGGNMLPMGQQVQGVAVSPYGQPMGGGQGMPGPDPQALCETTDAEIIDIYTMAMNTGEGDGQMAEAMCPAEARKAWGTLSMAKFENARCIAEAELYCLAGKEAAEKCRAAKPDELAANIVNIMCRRVTGSGNAAESALVGIASKLVQLDPAAANQLWDTAESAERDMNSLGILDIVLGNADYAAKSEKRAKNMDDMLKKMEDAGLNDPEITSTIKREIEAQTAAKEAHSSIFGILGRILR
ncbi:MAG: hypothetical protein V1676_04110 [Candidatus Diapherotrites archaeon]